MKKIIAFCIGSVACYVLTAQPRTGSNTFSSQLNELINNAREGFKTIPKKKELQGALASEIGQDYDGTLFYHFTFAKNIPFRKADALLKQLTEKIKFSLGDDYTQQQRSESYHLQENSFTNKSKLSFEVIILTKYNIYPKYDMYLDIFCGKKKRMEYVNYIPTPPIKDTPEIAKRVIKIIIDKLGVDESQITPTASFIDDLGADDLETIELIMEFEKEFNISIPDKDCAVITTVGNAIAYLEEHVNTFNNVK